MKLKMRYLWEKEWFYIDFQKDNTGVKFTEFEKRKTTRLQLWTGLKDKFDKELFVGDIVRFKGYHFTKGLEVGVILFSKSAYRFGNSSWGMRLLTKDEIELCKVEVIGNIYENPELLEVKK